LVEIQAVGFPGNLQGRHAKETGSKGVVMVIVEDGRIVNVEPIHVDIVRWAQLSVDLSAVEPRKPITASTV
jgi:hypothetical protein